MNGIQISRNILVPNQGWKRISLEEGETMDVIGRVRLINTSLMKVCLEDAQQMGGLSPTNKVRVAIALFEKLGLHSFTAYREELADKADSVRAAARKTEHSADQPGEES